MDEAWLGIAEAGRLFRSRALSPVELLRALLARIGRLDRACHAFIRLLPQSALEEAQRAEAEMVAGQDRGPLHGIPFAVKDNIDVAGVATTCNSAVPDETIARDDAEVVRRLRDAGAVLIGKLTLHEFGAGGAMFDLPWPAARNPWDLTRHPGGSSSGAGTAVAAGLVPLAIGTDTGGSVRHPATACGILGMKPTIGRVSCKGIFPLSASLDHVGPMTRFVEDNALALDALSPPARPGSARTVQAGVRGLRIGVVEHFHAEDAAADPQYVASLEAAVAVLRALGARVEPVRLPRLGEWTQCGRVIQQFEQYRVHERWLKSRPEKYSAFAREKLAAGEALSADDYAAALREQSRLRAALAAASDSLDALVTLSSLDLPCRLDDRDAVRRTYGRQLRMPFNVSGTPALAVPTGFTDGGLPLGMQIAAKAHEEAMIYRIAWAYCDASRCAERRPSIATTVAS